MPPSDESAAGASHDPPKVWSLGSETFGAQPGVAGMAIAGADPPKVMRVRFAPSAPKAARAALTANRPQRGKAARTRRTRLRPPSDVIRLSDRLGLLLQPPIETLINAESIRFPAAPFPFQMDGVAFLYPRSNAVVADEMGLGKTVQAITAMRLLAHAGQLHRALVVCPKPLVSNWRRELERWAPEFGVTEANGPPSRREWVWRQKSAPIVLAGYETVVRDRALINELPEPFDLVVLDEAQRIKNQASATHSAVCAIPRQRSWALTGTPIENSIDDLVGVYEFVSPGLLRPGMPVRAIASAVRDSVIRRTKDRVLTELPPKVVADTHIDLSPEQWHSYQQAEQHGVVALERIDEDQDQQLTIQHVFELVLRLKQICNFDPLTQQSSKADRLEADLEECQASGRKAIVFSQWVDTLDRLEERLARFSPECFHGRMSTAQRERALVRFRDDPECGVLLMSYGAGSVGLNLQFARYVFLFDRWWNPAVEDQAINRAHRIGAAGSVTVSRFLSVGTIEERIDAVLQEKRELFARVFESDLAPRSRGLTRDDLLALFDWRVAGDPERFAA